MNDTPTAIPGLMPEEVEARISGTTGLFVLDFWAPWCAPCRAMLTLMEEIAHDFAGRITFAKFNVDDDSALSVAKGIRGVPTLIFYQDGVEVERLVGTESPGALRDRLRRLIGEVA